MLVFIYCSMYLTNHNTAYLCGVMRTITIRSTAKSSFTAGKEGNVSLIERWVICTILDLFGLRSRLQTSSYTLVVPN